MILCTKMNGNGNDFLVINNMELKYSGETLSMYAKALCRRRESLGADGILAVEPSETHDFKMRLFNRDGTEGEMCGNGARCIARYAFLKGIVKKPEMTFETLGGRVDASVRDARTTLCLSPVNISDLVHDVPASVEGYDFSYTFLTVGVPHAVIFEEKRLESEDRYRKIGRAIRFRTDLFPEGANINFVSPKSTYEAGLDVITYERGVEDLTLSCGTGSAASAIAAFTAGLTGPVVDVYNPGGLNRVSLEFGPSGKVFPELEGGASYIAEIEASEEALVQDK
ncbi:MAG TPA: diaminopimelate epimerase [Synergistaceae bacterium]|nr:diaminopimelate epimerase [Synergistaceae bacterium]